MRGLLFICLFVAMGAPVVTAADTNTSNDLDSLGRLFIAGVNADSSQEQQGIVQQLYSEATLERLGADRLIGLFKQLSDEYGELTYHHTERIRNSLHVFARSESNGQWHDFQFRFDAGPPLRLQQLAFIADVAEPVYLPNGGIDNSFTLNWLADYIDKLVKENDLAASLLIARGDSVIFERYVGFADAARSRKIGPDTPMNLGSGNKMFTALSIMQLRDAGKLKLTNTLDSYFPDFPEGEFAGKATIANLLSHTSGLGDYWDDNYEKVWGQITKLEQVLPFVYDDSIAFAPGTSFQYSNSGFLLAGLIVQRVAGIDYFDYVRDHIYKPLQMTHTDSYLRGPMDTVLAQGLSKSDSSWVVAPSGIRGTSAGGGYSTPRDMLKFAQGLKQGSIVNESTLEEMTSVKNSSVGGPFPYGYGFMLSYSGNKLVSYGHAGIAPGVNFAFEYFPDKDLTFVIFSNQDNGAYDDLRKNIIKLITGDR